MSRKTTNGVKPRIEAADTNPQSIEPFASIALKMKIALVNVYNEVRFRNVVAKMNSFQAMPPESLWLVMQSLIMESG